ncbi:hypothetical protein EVAR_2845_1 [Eumeta japonica]|uniref:Uncharacterized protein n=1 Tax=Eumeta variegata TaxID=151549 RepID=A0A4C1T0V6_EUMVA|nr:hypothetical protein EVAR_2845_1 [Eumeta japonica]
MRNRTGAVYTVYLYGTAAQRCTKLLRQISAWPHLLNYNLCNSHVQADAPFINCSGFGASVPGVLQLPQVKLVLKYRNLNINAFHHYLCPHRKKSIFRVDKRRSPKYGLRIKRKKP